MWNAIADFDRALMTWLRQVDTPWLDTVMAWVSAGSGAGAVWLLLATVALFRPRDRAAGWRVLLTVALAYLVVDGVFKPVIARPRPPVFAEDAGVESAASRESVRATAPKRMLPPIPRTYSFPSGHATATFGAVLAVSRMWPRTALLWWTLAALVGYSRIYLGHHYPLDVIGGALLGTAIAMWVLGGRHRATDAATVPHPLPAGMVIRP